MGLPPSQLPLVPTGLPTIRSRSLDPATRPGASFIPGTRCRSDCQRLCHPQPGCQTGNILVNSVPSGASAILDNGYDQLTTPGTFTAVSSGWHNVQVSKSGYRLYSTSVEVKPGITSSVYGNPRTEPANRINIGYFTSRRGQPVCGYHLSGTHQPDRRQPCCRSSFGNPEKIRL